MGAGAVVRAEKAPSRFRKRSKWIYGGAAVVIVLGAGAMLYMRSTQTTSAVPTSNIYTVGLGSVTETVSTSGTIQVPTQINMNFQGSAGVLTKVNVKVGSQVKAGQVLAQVDDTSAKAQLIQAQANLQQAQAKLQEAQAGATSAVIAQDKMNIQKAQQSFTAAQQSYLDQLAIVNDPTQSQQQLVSAQNQVAQAQQALTAAQNSATYNQQLANLQVQQDESNLSIATTNFNNAEAQYSITIDSTSIEAAYQAYLAAVQASSNPSTDAAVSTAQTKYNNMQSVYNAYTQAENQLTKDQLAAQNVNSNVASAQASYNSAQANLQALQAQLADHNQTQQTLDNMHNQVLSAQLNLQSAQQQLKLDQAPPDAATLASDQASVTSAEAQLQTAQAAENNTMLKAPISGIITQVNGLVGETPSAGSSSSSSGSSAFIVLDDTVKSDLQVNIQVSESQIGSIHNGEPIELAVSAYAGKTYQGTITQVYPTPAVVSNVTEYTVIATVSNTSGDLKPGMTADVSIQTAHKDNVLTVPAISLVQVGNFEGVYVVGNSSSTSGGFGGGSGFQGNGSGSGSSGSRSSTGQSSGSSGSRNSTGQGSSGQSGRSFNRSGFNPSGVKLPKNVHFQPVQVGLFGTGTVEITRGLQAGEEIMRVPPGTTTTTTTTSNSRSGFGGGFGGLSGGGNFRRGNGG